MRLNKPYISIQKKHGKYRVYVAIKPEVGLKVDTSTYSNGIQLINDIQEREREVLGGSPPTTNKIKCKKLEIYLVEDLSPSPVDNVIHLISEWFTRDVGVDHIWVKVVLENGLQPNDGAIGNYDDPDD